MSDQRIRIPMCGLSIPTRDRCTGGFWRTEMGSNSFLQTDCRLSRTRERSTMVRLGDASWRDRRGLRLVGVTRRVVRRGIRGGGRSSGRRGVLKWSSSAADSNSAASERKTETRRGVGGRLWCTGGGSGGCGDGGRELLLLLLLRVLSSEKRDRIRSCTGGDSGSLEMELNGIGWNRRRGGGSCETSVEGFNSRRLRTNRGGGGGLRWSSMRAEGGGVTRLARSAACASSSFCCCVCSSSLCSCSSSAGGFSSRRRFLLAILGGSRNCSSTWTQSGDATAATLRSCGGFLRSGVATLDVVLRLRRAGVAIAVWARSSAAATGDALAGSFLLFGDDCPRVGLHWLCGLGGPNGGKRGAGRRVFGSNA